MAQFVINGNTRRDHEKGTYRFLDDSHIEITTPSMFGAKAQPIKSTYRVLVSDDELVLLLRLAGSTNYTAGPINTYRRVKGK